MIHATPRGEDEAGSGRIPRGIRATAVTSTATTAHAATVATGRPVTSRPVARSPAPMRWRRGRSATRQASGGRRSSRARRGAAGRATPQPQRGFGRAHGLVRDAPHLETERLEVDVVAQSLTEHRDDPLAVVPGAIEATIDGPLHPPPHGLEEG